MEKSSIHPNGWVLTDVENGLVARFEDGLFNETQRITLLGDIEVTSSTATHLARLASEMADWAVRHHASILTRQPYGLEYSEDNTTLYLYRRKSPAWRIPVEDGDLDRLAGSLRKAAEWIKKRAGHDK